jgi:hypothetical protein
MKKESGGLLSNSNKKACIKNEKSFNYDINNNFSKDYREIKDTQGLVRNTRDNPDNKYYTPSMSKSPTKTKLNFNQSTQSQVSYVNYINSYSQSQMDKTSGAKKKLVTSNNYLTDSKSVKPRDVSGDRAKTPIPSKSYVSNSSSQAKKNKPQMTSTSNINVSLRNKIQDKNRYSISPGPNNPNKFLPSEDYICNDNYMGHPESNKRYKSPTLVKPINKISREYTDIQENSIRLTSPKENFLSKSQLKNKNYDTSVNNYLNFDNNLNSNSESIFTNYRKIKKQNENNFSHSIYKTETNYIPPREVVNNMKYSTPNTEESNALLRTNFNTSKNELELSEKSHLKTKTHSNNSFSNKIFLEKKESFSLNKTMTNQYESDPNLLSSNKETTDSIKYKLTNTNSSGPTSAMHLEDVKALFEKLDPEEYHLISINLIQSSKKVVRKHEDISDKDNLFSTVTKCEERDL